MKPNVDVSMAFRIPKVARKHVKKSSTMLEYCAKQEIVLKQDIMTISRAGRG
jgi:hypothetical protein